MANARGIPHGSRITLSTVFSLKGLIKTLILFAGTQFVVFLWAGITILIGRYAHDSVLSFPSLVWLLEYWPISWESISMFFTWLISLNFLWTGFVLFNHWNDVVSLISSMTDHSIFGVVGTIFAFWYVTCWSMGYEFIQTLFSDPMNIGGTRAVLELVIGYGNVGYYLGTIVTFIGSQLPLAWDPVYQLITGLIPSGWGYITSKILFAVKSAWVFLVSHITGFITPVVPAFFQPIADAVAVPLSKLIAFTFLLWILRIFFGFPF